MPRTANAVGYVDKVSGISPHAEAPRTTATKKETPERYVKVVFRGAKYGLINTATTKGAVWADVLESLRKSNNFAYVEIDPKTNVITELHLPLEVKVGEVRNAEEGVVEVELIISQAIHYLRRSNPNFRKILALLETAKKKGATVLVTETHDGQQIIDVRSVRTGSRGQ